MKRSYFAIIPAIVRYDTSLTGNAKLLYGELTALSNDKGYCWATNQYFADLYGVSKRTISLWIKQLENGKYIKTKLNYKADSKEVANRFIFILPFPVDTDFYEPDENNFTTYGNKFQGGGEENFTTPGEKNFADNNTLINNTINNTKELKDITPFEKKARPSKHKYGEFNNVLLTDDELAKLKDKFDDWQQRIDKLSAYIGSTGKKYKSHYITILNWAKKDKEQPQKQFRKNPNARVEELPKHIAEEYKPADKHVPDHIDLEEWMNDAYNSDD